jgi:uncharacterized SAM-binding protein YcdF (DUF218 family)
VRGCTNRRRLCFTDMIRTTLSALMLPPTGLLVLLAIGLLLLGRRQRFGRPLAWASLTALVLLGMPAVSQSMLGSLESGFPTTYTPEHAPQAIIVLGGEITRTSEEPLGVRPGPLTFDRLHTAVALQRRTGLPILVTGGITQAHAATVGVVMQKSLRDDFQSPARWVETQSSDTWENARFSADILRGEGVASVYVVTHPWHMRRALLAFQGTGLTVTAAPTPSDDWSGPEFGDFLPRASGWQTGYYALHEWIGYAWYRLR